jgi:O-antigen ligase
MAPRALAGVTQTETPFVTGLLLAYVFLLISRLFEFAALYGAGNLYLMLVTSTVGVVVAVMSGGLFRIFRSAPAKLLMAFTFWLMMATVTSSWHAGSIGTLKDMWVRSVLAFLVVAGLISTYQQFRKAVFAAAWGGLTAAVLLYLAGGISNGRFALDTGTFSNANEVAYHLLFIFPLCGFVFLESGKLSKLLILGMTVPALLVILRTGSRGGLIIIAAQLIMILFRVSMANKVKVLAAGFVVAILLVTMVGGSALDRYKTLTSDADASAEYDSAKDSAQARFIHLKQSLELTAIHPLFGVGPGVFKAASAELSSSEGTHQMWAETHNAYTQVSSECGVPGLILFVSVLFSGWRILTRAQRLAKKTGDPSLGNLAFCLKLTLVAFIINGFFTSDAYEYYLPLAAAFTVAMDMTLPWSALAMPVPAAPRRAPARSLRPGGHPSRPLAPRAGDPDRYPVRKRAVY